MSELVHNRAQFERTVETLIRAADRANRGADLDRVVSRLDASPDSVTLLAGLMAMIDDDVRPHLSASVDAYRRFRSHQGDPADDEAILAVMRAVYARVRGG